MTLPPATLSLGKCSVSGEVIKQGKLRIGKEVNNPFKAGNTMFVWHLANALFESFRKGSAEKPRIEDAEEVVGMEDLNEDDQEMLNEMIAAEQEFRAGLAEVEDDATRQVRAPAEIRAPTTDLKCVLLFSAHPRQAGLAVHAETTPLVQHSL